MSTFADDIARSHAIPAFPKILSEILFVADDPGRSISDLEPLVSQELALSTRLIHLANSGYYGGKGTKSVHEAIARLGGSTVKSLSTAILLLDTLSSLPKLNRNLLKQCWTTALTATEVSKMLTRKKNPSLTAPLFWALIAGPIGRVLLAAHYGERYDQIAKLPILPSRKKEEASFSTHHLEVGKCIAIRWSFPKESLDIIDELIENKQTDATKVFALTEALAQWIAISRHKELPPSDKFLEQFKDTTHSIGIEEKELIEQTPRFCQFACFAASLTS